MALSVFFSVIPLLLSHKKWYIYVSGIMVCIIAMSSSYQASSGIFPMLVIVLGIRRWIRGEKLGEVCRFYLISAGGFLLGLLMYRTFFMKELNAYATTAMAPWSELISSAIANYKRYIVHFLQGFNLEWLAVAFAICICFLWTAVRCSRQNKLLTFVLVGLGMIVMFALAFGVYPFLMEPLFYPRPCMELDAIWDFWGFLRCQRHRRGVLQSCYA